MHISSVEEIETALTITENEQQCVTQELPYYKLTHPTKFSSIRQKFRVRGITHDEKLENLKEILSSAEELREKLAISWPASYKCRGSDIPEW